jgi:branched-chain amino acid transport system substrate-binding protein
LKAPYVTNVHFGSTDVGPIALGMKNAGVDSAFLATVPSTGFALAAALKQVGAKNSAILLPTGYGGDLLQSSAGVQAAQGFYFSTQLQPVELNTPATQVLTKRLAAAGESSGPGFAESSAYLSLAAFARGIQAAGSNLSQANYMDSLRKVTGYDAEGLLAPNKIDFSSYDPPEQCSWYVKLQGNKFVPVTGLAPICGKKLSD